jgi:hypothetical protein
VTLTGGVRLEVGGARADKPGLLFVTAGQLALFDGAELLSNVRGGRAAPIFVDSRSILIDGHRPQFAVGSR